MCVCDTKAIMEMEKSGDGDGKKYITKENGGKKINKNLKGPYISVSLGNTLRTIATILYPGYYSRNPLKNISDNITQ